MARAHFVTYLLDSAGNTIPGATVSVRNPGTEVLISETIYAADDPDVGTKTNPFTADADGKCEIWLAVPKVVDLYITKTGFDPVTIRATAHQLTAATLTMKDDGTPLAQRGSVNFVNGFTLTDDAANNETEVSPDYAGTAELVDADAAAEAAGTSGKIARGDHKHSIANAAAGASAPGDAAAVGTATSMSRSDHKHGREAYAAVAQLADVDAAAESAGADASVARGDHKHGTSTAAAGASAPGDSAAVGTATSLARSDHRHSREAAQAPSTADYLVGTAQAGLSGEIVVGAAPGGELGGTWASPTVDSTHSGSAHHSQNHDADQHTWMGVSLWMDTNEAVVDGVEESLSDTSTWTERIDTDAAHSGTDGNITIPAAWNGQRARFTGQIRWAADTAAGFRQLRIARGGGVTDVAVSQVLGHNTAWDQDIKSPVFTVSTGEVYKIYANHNSGATQTVVAGELATWIELEILGS